MVICKMHVIKMLQNMVVVFSHALINGIAIGMVVAIHKIGYAVQLALNAKRNNIFS